MQKSFKNSQWTAINYYCTPIKRFINTNYTRFITLKYNFTASQLSVCVCSPIQRLQIPASFLRVFFFFHLPIFSVMFVARIPLELTFDITDTLRSRFKDTLFIFSLCVSFKRGSFSDRRREKRIRPSNRFRMLIAYSSYFPRPPGRYDILSLRDHLSENRI